MPTDLKKIRLFTDFTREELEEVRKISRREKISQGEFAFQEGTAGETLILLDMGTLKLIKKTREGEEQELVQLGSGTFVGEMSFFDQELRSASGVAMENCQVTMIPFPSIRNDCQSLLWRAAIRMGRLHPCMTQRKKALRSGLPEMRLNMPSCQASRPKREPATQEGPPPIRIPRQ